MEILWKAEWDLNRVQRSYEPIASEIFFLPESTGPAIKGTLAIFALFLKLYDHFVGYSSDFLFFMTVLFLRSLILETISEIQSVNFKTPNNASASCITVQE